MRRSPMSSALEISITEDVVTISGHPFPHLVSAEALAQALGAAPRIVEPETPAPVGHRNIEAHVFDDFGILAHRHHTTPTARHAWSCLRA